jgi:serine phosphatase RsbU (regulator of sigma subunit)
LLILGLVLFSYGWFGTFFRLEGKRYFAAHTEIELASRIQEQLVPPVNDTVDGVEIYGISIPSGTVGGDLLDLVKADGLTCAYVADVAGHGVAAGVTMSMVKTAARMHFMASPPTGAMLLERFNDTLTPLTEPSAYATVAYLLIIAGCPGRVFGRRASSNDSLPTKKWHGISPFVDNFPVAMFTAIRFKTGVIDFESGDLIAIVTDGLTEVMNTKNEELGDSYIETVLTQLKDVPLSEIAEEILRLAKSFGRITDDQTLLLLRRT